MKYSTITKLHYMLIAISLIFSTVSAGELRGRVVGITDGDTITLLTPKNEEVKIRLAEIDAPEKGQPYGKKSKAVLSDLIYLKEVIVTDTSLDRYGRTIGRVYLGFDSDRTLVNDISARMLGMGAAWVYTKYSKDLFLALLQDRALLKKSGLWASEAPVPPWEWRQGKREGTPKTAPDPDHYAESFAGIRAKAAKGDIHSQFSLGLSYETGRYIPRDLVESRKWYLLAAEQGYGDAQSALGLMYEEDATSPGDYLIVAKWYSLAAEQGDSLSQYRLGLLYEAGHGVSKDTDKAVYWYRLAGFQGDSDAQMRLGDLTAIGRYVKQDYRAAYAWYLLALLFGSDEASEAMSLIEKHLSSQDRAEAIAGALKKAEVIKKKD